MPNQKHRGSFNRWTLVRLLVGACFACPIAWAIWASFQPIDVLFSAATHEPAKAGVTRQAYEQLLGQEFFPRFLLNSLVLSTLITVGTVFSASLGGYALARLPRRAHAVTFMILVATLVVPAQALLLPRFLVFRSLGWVNTYKPLIIPAWLAGSAYFVFLFRQYFLAVPQEFEDAARIDGATTWQLYRRIMLPLARPVVGVTAVLCAVGTWQAFMEPLIYLSDFCTYPVSVGLRMLQATDGSWANLIMAGSVLAMFPPLIMTLLLHRYLLRPVGLS